MDKTKKVLGIVDRQIKNMETHNIETPLQICLDVKKELQPIETFFLSFGERSDPMANTLMTALDQFRLSLDTYYQIFSPKQPAYIRALNPSLRAQFTKTFREIMQSHVINTGTCLKMYLKMVLYETAENYTEFFPVNVMKNHELFMTQATQTLEKYYLAAFLSELKVDRDNDECLLSNAVYKAFKPFGFAWQQVIIESWKAHCQAFQRISRAGFGENLSEMVKLSKTLESLKMAPSEWKRNLKGEKLTLMLLMAFKDHPITVFQLGNQAAMVINPKSNTENITSPRKKEVEILSPANQDVITNFPSPLSELNSAQEPKIEAQLPSIKGHLNSEVAGLDSSAQGKEREKRKSESIEEIQDQNSNKRNKNSKEDPSTLIAPKSGTVSHPLNELNGAQEQKAMEQAVRVIEFYHDLEVAGLTSSVHGKKRDKEKQKLKNNRKDNKRGKRAEKNLSAPITPKPEESQKDRIILPLGRKMTGDAIKDFLKAFNQISPPIKEALHPSILQSINVLQTDHYLKLKKAYKLMLSIVPHIGTLEYDRGKGSHSLITIYCNGFPK